MSLQRFPRYLWTLPTTALGLPFVVLAWLGGGRVRRVRGVLEVEGPLVAFFLEHGALVSGGALAMTLGHVVLGRDRFALSETRSHERVHVRQAERWGPLFLLVYVAASVEAGLRTGRWYEDNRFEVEARALSDDSE